ncbi:hypothetical protein D3C81_1342750 [compost metagenome]
MFTPSGSSATRYSLLSSIAYQTFTFLYKPWYSPSPSAAGNAIGFLTRSVSSRLRNSTVSLLEALDQEKSSNVVSLPTICPGNTSASGSTSTRTNGSFSIAGRRRGPNTGSKSPGFGGSATSAGITVGNERCNTLIPTLSSRSTAADIRVWTSSLCSASRSLFRLATVCTNQPRTAAGPRRTGSTVLNNNHPP